MKSIVSIYFMLFICGILQCNSLVAQSEISVELRPRFEFRRGYKAILPDSLKDDPAMFVSQRTRLNIYYLGKHLNAGISMQDVRVWGDASVISSSGVFGKNASLDLHEGWLEIILPQDISLKIGRQIWKYDDQRLLAERNWNQIGISYDALLLKFKKNGWSLDAGFSYNNDLESFIATTYNPNKMKTLNFIHLQWEREKRLKISGIIILSGYQAEGTTSTIYCKNTFGTDVNIKLPSWNFHAAGYFQNGRNNKGEALEAYCLVGEGEFSHEWLIAGAGINLLSGDNVKKTDSGYIKKDHLFDILYGARHRYYGTMDYFSNIPKSTLNGGLVDLFAKLEFKFCKKHRASIYYHFFSLQNNVADPIFSGSGIEILDKYMGSEIDILYSFQLNTYFSVEAGYSTFFPTSTMEKINNMKVGTGSQGHWAYVMVTFKPVLFKTDKTLL